VKRSIHLVPAVALTLTLVAASCGSDEPATTPDDTSSAESAPATAGSEPESSETDTDEPTSDIVAEAEAKVAELTALEGIDFPGPTEAFDIGEQRVAIISCGQAGIGCQQMSEFATEAAETAGWTASPTFDGEFDPALQAGFVEQAINEDYDAIVLASIDAASIKAALDAAEAAGIPVACIICENTGFDGAIIDSTTGGAPGGEAIGWWIIADSQGESNSILFHDAAFPIVTQRMVGIRSVLDQCEGCTHSEIDIPTTDLQAPGPPTWTGALAANPPDSFGYAVAPYDFFSIPFANTALEQGRDEIKIAGFDAWSEMVLAIEAGDQGVNVTVAAPFQYAAWAAIDQVGRQLAGLEAWDSTTLPLRLVTANNASAFTNGYFEPDFEVSEYFGDLWGGQ